MNLPSIFQKAQADLLRRERERQVLVTREQLAQLRTLVNSYFAGSISCSEMNARATALVPLLQDDGYHISALEVLG